MTGESTLFSCWRNLSLLLSLPTTLFGTPAHIIPPPCLLTVILTVLNPLRSTAYSTSGRSKEVRAWPLNILFAGPAMAQNGTGDITWKTSIMQSSWSANMRKDLINEGVDFFFVRGEVVTVLPLLSLSIHFPLSFSSVLFACYEP